MRAGNGPGKLATLHPSSLPPGEGAIPHPGGQPYAFAAGRVPPVVRSQSVRSTTALGGLWNFCFLGAVEFEDCRPGELDGGTKAWVPSAFDAQARDAGRRGVAVYQTVVSVPPGRAARLEFGAVSIRSRVFVDGELLREHACGYSPFVVEVPASPRGARTVTVLVDNRFDTAAAPLHESFFDFYQYGGVLREVTLHVLPARGPWIETVEVTPTDGYDRGEVEVCVRLRAGEGESARITLAFDGETVAERSLDPQAGEWRGTLRVPAPRLWSPERPGLHRLRVAVHDAATGEETDDHAVRFGLRRIEARGGKLWLNGEPLRLRGYNRHEWHPNHGPCTPAAQMAADLDLLRDLGCNFVRGSHYPQDQRFLDLCDELGFLVWEETLGWQNTTALMGTPRFRQQHAEALRAMVAASRHHPCVIIWGFLNEVQTDGDDVRPVMEESAALLRSLDPSRLVSYASRLAETDRHFDLVDVVSVNLYPGWYGCEDADDPLALIAPRVERCLASIDARGFADKPVIVAEIGAEGLYGWHDQNHDFFTEEYQAAYLERACAVVLGHARCSGLALWLFSDVRAAGRGRSLNRPRAFNNKGTLDEYRRPKAAYQVVRRAFHADRDALSAAS